jgi:hypothetical protein
MRITLEPINPGDIQVTIDSSMDRKLFLELLLPAYKKDLLGDHEHPYPLLLSDFFPSPPKAAELRTERGWICTYDCTQVVAAEYKVKFPTYNMLWVIIQFDTLKVTVKGPSSVTVFKIPPPEGVIVDPETHQIQV